MEIRVALDAAAAAHDAATLVARVVTNAARRRGEATVAVSGGTTPAAMFAILVTLAIPWRKVTIWQVDERVAPDGDPQRNANLLVGMRDAGATVRLMPATAADLNAAAQEYAQGLPPRFDLVHLGLGDDGHTASWPPDDPVVDATTPVALSSDYRGTRRMTLTPAVVNAARRRVVLATGSDKATAVRGWMLRDGALPINRVHRAGTVAVLDAAAASLLPRQ